MCSGGPTCFGGLAKLYVLFPLYYYSSLTISGNNRHVASRRSFFLLDPTSTVRTLFGRAYHYVNHCLSHDARVSTPTHFQQHKGLT
jgi:hypothetical protein